MDPLDVTPEQCLEQALASLRDPAKRPPDKCVVLFLWDEKVYDTKYFQGGMRLHELIALLEIQKTCLINHMMREATPREDDDHEEDRP